MNWKNVKSRISSYVGKPKPKQTKKPTKKIDKSIKDHKRKLQEIKNRKPKKQKIESDSSVSEPEQEEINDIPFDTVKKTYFVHYINKFGEVVDLEDYQPPQGSKLAHLEFDKYLFEGYSFPFIVNNTKTYNSYLKLIDHQYQCLANE